MEPPTPPEPDETIDCIDCGGEAHRLTPPPGEGFWQVGELVVYRCEDCGDRWDILLGDPDELDDA